MPKKRIATSHIFIYILLGIGAIVMIVPFLWSLLTSFKTLSESLEFPPKLFPADWSFKNYTDVWHALPFPYFFWNTFVMIAVRVVVSTALCALAGFAFARIRFKGSNILFLLVLLPMMIPGQVYILPQYLLVSDMGLVNTVTALIIPGIASAFGTFLMRQFFMSVPDELEEAATLDGCNTVQIFFKIMLPLAKAPLTSLAIFTSLFAWKDLMWPLIVNMSPEKMPLSSGLALLQGQYTTNYPQLMAGSVIATIPMVILFIIFQKKFVQGVASTGSKN
ncbi:carbohydrate ABC transporter permease [Listeria booriae]|uniref:carbohydrate ABC transporter permease n=1 Tax=Listeria booriae TaxID=1552123 RepID=UPI001629B979|nr:carbohydrate ABC transporter permease [Listeria booriae]MBC1210710.1 carbohydrate ABC transporter permease [Listeria booriae]